MAHNHFKQWVFLGPPGSGKGTQAETLAQRLGVPHISTGDIFRDHIARRTALGLEIDSILRQGRLVPDEVTNKIVAERLQQPDAKIGFVLDGYPRNLAQAEFLASLAPQAKAVLLELPDEEAVRRISRRWTCVKCQEVYHLDYKPPQKPGACDVCGGELGQRTDQRAEVVQDRLLIYHREVDPLLSYYEGRGELLRIDGRPSIPEVTANLASALGL